MDITDLPPTRPCALPHSAPLSWLQAPAEPTTPAATTEPAPDDDRRDAIRWHMDELERLARELGDRRPDVVGGWTAFNRKIFLSVLAETGRVNHACDCVQLSKQSAYALRARDPVFAAGWNAAAELARDALADELLDRALHGQVETIVRGGEVVAERRKFDGRLSMAVLNRLDRRCDRLPAERGPHAHAMADWQGFLDAVGNGDDAAVASILHPQENARPSQPSQPEDDAPVWQDEITGEWHTSFRDPDFPEEEVDPDEGRPCSAEEAELLTAYFGDERAETAAAEARDRESWFADLRAGLAERVPAEPDVPDVAAEPSLHEAVAQQGNVP